MNLHKSIAVITAMALMMGSVLFAWGIFASSAQAATSTDSTTVEKLKEKNEELRDKVEVLNKEIERYKRTTEEQRETIVELKEDGGESIKELRTQIERLKEKNEEYERTMKEKREKIHNLKEEASHYMEDDIKELKERIEGLREKNGEYERTMEKQREMIRDLKEKLGQGVTNKNREEIKDLKERAKEMEENAKARVREMKEKAKEKMEEMKEDVQEVKEQARKKIKEVKKEYMNRVGQLKKMAQQQKRKGQAEGSAGDEDTSQNKAKENIMRGLKEHFDQLPEDARENISTFLSRGVSENTRSLGLGERKAVIESFQQAYGELPKTENDMARALMIANGRFPDKKSKKAEKEAKEKFIEVYDRIPNMEDPQDQGAVMTMAYGLRQQAQNRNLESEQQGLSTFKDIFGHLPQNTQEWNVMQAITYSGAEKKEDSDKDLLPDEREKELGTNPDAADTDGDGHKDGREVLKGYDPLQQ